jgi:hypothetical protein
MLNIAQHRFYLDPIIAHQDPIIAHQDPIKAPDDEVYLSVIGLGLVFYLLLVVNFKSLFQQSTVQLISFANLPLSVHRRTFIFLSVCLHALASVRSLFFFRDNQFSFRKFSKLSVHRHNVA